MKKIRIAINGFGRIGRHALRASRTHKNIEIVAINDLTDTKTLAHLLEFDTAYPSMGEVISYDEKHIIVGKQKIKAFAEKEPAKLPWKELKVDVVLECTGRFTDTKSASAHVVAGARKVLLSAPGKDDMQTLVLGVNDDAYEGKNVINNASCTTNCAAPMMRVLESAFGVEKAMLTTIHSYTADQNLQDGPHRDLRRARAAAQNIVPTSTGAAIAVTETLPSIKNKFDGLAIRVPTITVSLTDITAILKKPATVEEINAAFVKASKTTLKGILAVTEKELVSSDFIGSPYSATVDLPLTMVVGGNMVKVVGWYDNEWGYANRLVEMAKVVGA
jgi:glyceraldehyde 3-phosphate dehydrogenase